MPGRDNSVRIWFAIDNIHIFSRVSKIFVGAISFPHLADERPSCRHARSTHCRADVQQEAARISTTDVGNRSQSNRQTNVGNLGRIPATNHTTHTHTHTDTQTHTHTFTHTHIHNTNTHTHTHTQRKREEERREGRGRARGGGGE